MRRTNPYKVEKRYRKMCGEDGEYTDMLYFYRIECGPDRTDGG